MDGNPRRGATRRQVRGVRPPAPETMPGSARRWVVPSWVSGIALLVSVALALAAPPVRAGPQGFSRADLVYGIEGRERRITLYEPEARPQALIVFLVGTLGEVLDPVALAYMTALAQRGYAVASVDYDNRFIDRFRCDILAEKARRIFDRAAPYSALNRLYAHSRADPAAGIGVIGFSQGGWIGHQAGHFAGDVRLKAALLLSTGRNVRLNSELVDIALPCNERAHNGVPRVLAVNGESDWVYTHAAPRPRAVQLREQLVAVTGIDCDGLRCRDGPNASARGGKDRQNANQLNERRMGAAVFRRSQC